MPEEGHSAHRKDIHVLADLEQLCREPGFIYALCLMVKRCLWIPIDEIADVNWYERPNQEELSLLFGLLVKSPVRLEEVPSEEAILGQAQQATELLEELHQSLSHFMFAGRNQESDDPDRLASLSQNYQDYMSSGKEMVEPIFYGAEGASGFQYLEMAAKKYAADERWMRKHVGVSIEAFVEIAEALDILTQDRLRRIGHSVGLRNESEAALAAMTFSLEDLSPIGRESLQHFFREFSFTPGSINQEFSKVSAYNAVRSHPIMALAGGNYCIPILVNLPKAIYESPYYWITRDNRYKDTADSNRGHATEGATYDLLALIFGQDRVFRGVKVNEGKDDITDIDVLAVSGNKAVIAQCKSKKLTIDARGGDRVALRKDFAKAVQDAYDQALLGRRALTDGRYRLSEADGVPIGISNRIDEVYILCVSSDHYPAVMPQARRYLKKKDEDPHPILLSIFDLDLISFYLQDRFEFLYYLRQRTAYAGHFVADTEASLLGYHLRHKLYPDENHKMAYVDQSYGQLVDANFLSARANLPKSEASQRLFHTWKNEAFDELVADIKRVASQGSEYVHAEDLLFFLYDLAGDGADGLVKAVEYTRKQTFLDGKEHSIRLLFSQQKRGITFASLPRPANMTHLQLLERKLESISRAHKYRSQVDEWMVLASFAGSPVRFDMLRYTKEPWRKDPEMERWVDRILGPGIPLNLDGRRQDRGLP